MVFSRLHMPWSSRDDQKTLAQLRETFPNENPEKLDQALKDAKGNYRAAVQILNRAQTQTNTGSMQLAPRKLQRPVQRQYAQPHPNFLLSAAGMHPHYQHAPPFQNNWVQPFPGHAPPPQHQPAFAPSPPHPGYMIPPQQQYPAPVYVRSDLSTRTLELLKQWPSAPMPVPPMPSAFQISQNQPMFPWTPSQPPVSAMEFNNKFAVPLYELPPPDLMDYDMSWMIAIRMLPEWSKWMEDRHWNEVRRGRSAAMRSDMGEDRDDCIIM